MPIYVYPFSQKKSTPRRYQLEAQSYLIDRLNQNNVELEQINQDFETRLKALEALLDSP